MAVTTSNSDYILKTLWPQDRVENTVYPDHAFLAMVPKREDFYGANMVLAVRYSDSQGRSAAFSTAQGAIGNHQGKKFTLTRVTDYQLVALNTESILASENDKGALIRNLDTELDSGLNNIGKSLATSLYRGKSGYLAKVAVGGVSTVTLTLDDINDITSFEVGMVLVAFTAKSGGAAHATPATATVAGIDRDAGTLTMDQDVSATWAAGDFLFPNGDRGAKISGLEDWFPTTAPVGGDSFFGVDRSTDAVRLAGLRADISSLNPEEGVVTLFSRQAREGGRPSHLFVNHADFRNIEISIGSKVFYEDLSVGEIGFSALKVKGPKGDVMVMADQDCPHGRGYSIDMRTVKLYSLKKAPMILDLDGNRLSRVYNADQWECRIVYFAQLGCTAPGWNAVATLP